MLVCIDHVPRSGFHRVAPLGTPSRRPQTKESVSRGVLCEIVLYEIVLYESVSFEIVLCENLAEGPFEPQNVIFGKTVQMQPLIALDV